MPDKQVVAEISSYLIFWPIPSDTDEVLFLCDFTAHNTTLLDSNHQECISY